MVSYRRARVPGGTYFFTVTLRDRRQDWLTAHADLLRSFFRRVRHEHPSAIDAIVVLPAHLHTLWTLPADADYSGRWRAIKAGFSQSLADWALPVVRNRRREYDVWQGGYWEHMIRDDDDFARHVECIHHNPVKHGPVTNPFAWRWSSIHSYVRRGIIAAGWNGRYPSRTSGD